MTIADKLLQINQAKQDMKAALEAKGIPMTNVAFAEYANKILEISVEVIVDEYYNYAKDYYIETNNLTLFSNAWEHSLTVDPLEISENSSTSSRRGKAQYPNGGTDGVIIPYGVATIGQNAFRDWESNNKPLVIPDSVTSIGSMAFSRWLANNQPLVIPNSVTSIGMGAFANWEANNQQLVIPNSVTSIGLGAFSSWKANNQRLVIPDSVTSIDWTAFENWNSNTHLLVIPDSVTSIGLGAFNGWSLVPYVVILAITPPTLGSYTAFNNQNDAPIYVPDESVEAYKTATQWVNLADRIFSMNYE